MKTDRSSIANNPRMLAADLLYHIFEKGAYANLALEKELGENLLKNEDKNLVTEIVNGTTRMLKHLDWVLALFLAKDIKKINPWLRTILRMSAYQILFMDRIPAYACINDAVTITKAKTNQALSRVANGVLRNLERNKETLTYPEDKIQYLAVYYSHPEWIVKLLMDKYGPETTETILKFNNLPPALTVRSNQLRGTRQDLMELFEQQNIIFRVSERVPWAVHIDHLPLSLENTTSYKEGYFYVQNEASMLAASILQVSPGHNVYDLCSGVGGKTTHLAELMENKGSIRAYELYEQKLKLLQKNCDRLGLKIVTIYRKDILEIEADSPLAARVLLDVPCSGLGVLNRRADLRWRQSQKAMDELPQLQFKLLLKASHLVEKNGLLLYSTCTVNNAENEMLVRRFLKEKPEFKLENFLRHISYFGLEEDDQKSAEMGMLTVVPGKYGTDGMFYALMRRQT